jgi:hypothetical protein
MTVIGVPAQYAKRLRRENVAKAVASGAGSLVAVAAAPWASSFAGGVGVVIALAAAGAGVYVCQQARVAIAKNTAGIKAETAAARSLRGTSFDLVAYGALVGSGDCDVIVAGPQLAVVEVKHGRGVVRVESGRLRDDRKRFSRDPVRQATSQASAVGKLAGAFADAVVCVTGMTNRPFLCGNTIVCSAADLPGVLATLPRRLSQLQAASLAGQLRAQPT